jgi:hypothetical protein
MTFPFDAAAEAHWRMETAKGQRGRVRIRAKTRIQGRGDDQETENSGRWLRCSHRASAVRMWLTQGGPRSIPPGGSGRTQ